MSDDPINPSHYKSNGLEAIDVIEAFAADDYLLGSLLKYLLRMKKKGSPTQNAQKAQWFLDRIVVREAERERKALEAYEIGPLCTYPDGKL